MERFMEVVLPIFVLAAFVAFVYHKTQVKKGKKGLTSGIDLVKSWFSKDQK